MHRLDFSVLKKKNYIYISMCSKSSNANWKIRLRPICVLKALVLREKRKFLLIWTTTTYEAKVVTLLHKFIMISTQISQEIYNNHNYTTKSQKQ